MSGLGVVDVGLGMLLDQPVKRGLLEPMALAVDRGNIHCPVGLPTDGLQTLLT